MFGDDVFFDQLRKELPPVFTREFASEKIGRIFSAKKACQMLMLLELVLL